MGSNVAAVIINCIISCIIGLLWRKAAMKGFRIKRKIAKMGIASPKVGILFLRKRLKNLAKISNANVVIIMLAVEI